MGDTEQAFAFGLWLFGHRGMEDMGMTETEVRSLIVKTARQVKGLNFRVEQRARGGKQNYWTAPGWPDISGDYYGIGFYCEIKKPGGMLTQEQFDFIEAANKRKCIAFVANSPEQFLERLRALAAERGWGV